MVFSLNLLFYIFVSTLSPSFLVSQHYPFFVWMEMQWNAFLFSFLPGIFIVWIFLIDSCHQISHISVTSLLTLCLFHFFFTFFFTLPPPQPPPPSPPHPAIVFVLLRYPENWFHTKTSYIQYVTTFPYLRNRNTKRKSLRGRCGFTGFLKLSYQN